MNINNKLESLKAQTTDERILATLTRWGKDVQGNYDYAVSHNRTQPTKKELAQFQRVMTQARSSIQKHEQKQNLKQEQTPTQTQAQ